MMNLVTGAAGFIGHHLCEALLASGQNVVGIDNLNDYYDPELKAARLRQLSRHPGFHFRKVDLADSAALTEAFEMVGDGAVYHLAAQAGVRYSLENPAVYGSSNLIGFLNILERCRQNHSRHLVYASSSSVYGLNRVPFSPLDNVDHPVSLYAATKKANEAMAHSYSHLFGLPTTGLRFFTVYGPWGRPDMAAWLFADAILEGRPIRLFNDGRMERDFTYVDDIVDGVLRVGRIPPLPDPTWTPECPDPTRSSAPWRIHNIGNNHPSRLQEFLEHLESSLGKKAVVELHPIQPGDVERTSADITSIRTEFGFEPRTDLGVGLDRFAQWFLAWKRGDYSR